MNELAVPEKNKYVIQEGQEPKTTSRIIAEKFGKQHKNVLRDINKLVQCVDRLIFEPVTYIDAKGEARIEYLMGRKGYMLLAMGFTGAEALKIKVAFIDAFDAMEKMIRGEAKRAQADTVFNEFKALKDIAEIFGLKGNQAIISANNAIKRLHGVDLQQTLQIELKSDTQERYFIATELGSRMNMSAIKFNKLLDSKGLQTKIDNVWVPTELGKKYSILLETGKKHSNGTPVQQLKWFETVMDRLK